MKINPSDKHCAQALFEVLRDSNKERVSLILKKFVAFLFKYNKIKKIDNIIKEYDKCVRQAEGIIDLDVKSAEKLESTTLEKIKSLFGDKVEAVETIDKNLIGGVIIKTGNKILDVSIKTQLINLKNSILK